MFLLCAAGIGWVCAMHTEVSLVFANVRFHANIAVRSLLVERPLFEYVQLHCSLNVR